MPYIEKYGFSTYFEDTQTDGPTITLVNGYTRSSKDFNLLGKQLGSRGYRVITLDNRGSGRTTSQENFSVEDMASDVSSVLDECQVDATTLVGFSMGGIISRVAASTDDRISRLILVSTCLSADLDVQSSDWPSEQPEILHKLTEYFSDKFRSKNQKLIEAMSKNIAEEIDSGNFMARAAGQREALKSFQEQGDDPIRFEIPTLLIHGSQDRIIPRDRAVRLKEAIGNAKLVEFPEDGHMLLVENQQDLLEAIT